MKDSISYHECKIGFVGFRRRWGRNKVPNFNIICPHCFAGFHNAHDEDEDEDGVFRRIFCDGENM